MQLGPALWGHCTMPYRPVQAFLKQVLFLGILQDRPLCFLLRDFCPTKWIQFPALSESSQVPLAMLSSIAGSTWVHSTWNSFLLAGLLPSSHFSFLQTSWTPLRAAKHGMNSSISPFPASKAFLSFFLNLTISALTRHLVQFQTSSPVVWQPNEELLAHFEASSLEATLTFSTLNIDFVYHRVGNTEEVAENQGGGYFLACDF